jgi:hypothetical protein
MTDYKATPERWQNVENAVEIASQSIQWVVSDEAACLLELRARVEALEAAQPQPEPIDKEENDRRFHACMNLIKNATPEQIRAAAGLLERSSLVKRVALAISGIEDSSCWDEEAVNWSPEARAAIREVLAYLCEHELIGNYARRQLEQEAKI